MKNDSKSIAVADDAPSPEEQHRIEVKVDKMLDPRAPDPESEPPTQESAVKAGSLPPLDIFTDPKTAPDVPDDVMKVMAEPADDPQADTAPEPVKEEVTDDPKTDAAVDDIAAHESDAVLEAQDTETALSSKEPEKPNPWQRLKSLYMRWWRNKKIRYVTLAGLVVLLLVLAILPVTRSFALNTVGMRANANLTVLDNTTQLPLKNVTVRLGGATGTSNSSGAVILRHVKLGSQTLSVQKVAFAVINKKVSVSLGTNTFGNVALTAVGTQYKFTVVDYVSGKPVASATATSGQANARADKKGDIILTVKNPTSATLPVGIAAPGYRTANATVPVGSTAVTTTQLVSSVKELYISKQSGKYDVYKADIDGQNKQVLLAGTGTENSQLQLVASQDGSEAALVSTRDNVHDSGGYLEQALTLANVAKGTATTIDHSERIQIIGWFGDRVVYAEAKAGASAGNPSRYLLLSYDYKTNQRLQLDHANYFNDMVSAGGSIYYATSNEYAGGVSQFMKINADGTGKQALLVSEVWNIYHTAYSDFTLSTTTGWFTFSLGDSKPASTSTAYTGNTRLYVDGADGKNSLWVDTRDGKGTLIVYNLAAKKETILAEQTGITYPVRWLDDQTIIYRVSSPSETADYVVNVNGGSTKKVTDLTDATGLALWYYY